MQKIIEGSCTWQSGGKGERGHRTDKRWTHRRVQARSGKGVIS
jgi:hypothetical protein